MSPIETMAHPGASAGSPQDPALLQDAWAHRSSDELRTIIQHGWNAGDDFTGAARELERRSLAMTALADHEIETETAEQKTFLRFVVGLLTVIAIGGLLVGMFVW